LLLSAGACCTVTDRSCRFDISCPQGAQRQTRRLLQLLSIEGTDRWTLDRYIDPAPQKKICGQRK